MRNRNQTQVILEEANRQCALMRAEGFKHCEVQLLDESNMLGYKAKCTASNGWFALFNNDFKTHTAIYDMNDNKLFEESEAKIGSISSKSTSTIANNINRKVLDESEIKIGSISIKSTTRF